MPSFCAAKSPVRWRNRSPRSFTRGIPLCRWCSRWGGNATRSPSSLAEGRRPAPCSPRREGPRCGGTRLRRRCTGSARQRRCRAAGDSSAGSVRNGRISGSGRAQPEAIRWRRPIRRSRGPGSASGWGSWRREECSPPASTMRWFRRLPTGIGASSRRMAHPAAIRRWPPRPLPLRRQLPPGRRRWWHWQACARPWKRLMRQEKQSLHAPQALEPRRRNWPS